MRKSFHMELAAQRALLGALRRRLEGTSFLSLIGCRLACFPEGEWTILRPGAQPPTDRDVLVLALDPHLDVLPTPSLPMPICANCRCSPL
jgi:hypothetical protein